MDEMLNQLVEILDQEIRVYGNILKMSKDKTNAIVEGRVGELQNIVKLEQSLVVQTGRLEKAREELTGKLVLQFGASVGKLTLSDIIDSLKGIWVQKLKTCQSRITNILAELKNANELNSRLIRNSLEYIDFSINLLAAVDTGSNNYGNSGQVNDSKKRSFFDKKL